jgi:DNA-binding NarL/FixJ family response regulator
MVVRRTRAGGVAEPALPLTARECEILDLVAEGLTNSQVAERLVVSPLTVKKHLEHVYAKLGVSTRTAAAARVRRAAP